MAFVIPGKGVLPGAAGETLKDNDVALHTNPDGTTVGTIKIPFHAGNTGGDVAYASFAWDGDRHSDAYYNILSIKEAMAETASQRKATTSGVQSFMKDIDRISEQSGLLKQDKIYTDGTHDAAMQMHVSHAHGHAQSHVYKHYDANQPVNNQFGAHEVTKDNNARIVAGKKIVSEYSAQGMYPTSSIKPMDHNELRTYETKLKQKMEEDTAPGIGYSEEVAAASDASRASATQEALMGKFNEMSREFTTAIMPVLAEQNLKHLAKQKL